MTTGDLQLFTETHLMWCSWWSRELWPFNRSYKWASCFSLSFLLNCTEINHVKIYLHILNAYFNIFKQKQRLAVDMFVEVCDFSTDNNDSPTALNGLVSTKWTGSSIFSALTEHSNGFIHLCLIHPFIPIHAITFSYLLAIFNLIYIIYIHTHSDECTRE